MAAESCQQSYLAFVRRGLAQAGDDHYVRAGRVIIIRERACMHTKGTAVTQDCPKQRTMPARSSCSLKSLRLKSMQLGAVLRCTFDTRTDSHLLQSLASTERPFTQGSLRNIFVATSPNANTMMHSVCHPSRAVRFGIPDILTLTGHHHFQMRCRDRADRGAL